jgi:hypothetical protein
MYMYMYVYICMYSSHVLGVEISCHRSCDVICNQGKHFDYSIGILIYTNTTFTDNKNYSNNN